MVKMSSSQIPHKTEVGAIQIGLRDEGAVRWAYGEVMAAGGAVPGAVIAGVRVERQVSGVEMIVGAVRDATFGPVVLVGIGGVLTEALGDVVAAPALVGTRGALRMISRLRSRGVLSSSRGGVPPDIAALSSIVARVAEILANSDLEEIEINPLVWDGAGWLALDGLVRGRAEPLRGATLFN